MDDHKEEACVCIGEKMLYKPPTSVHDVRCVANEPSRSPCFVF